MQRQTGNRLFRGLFASQKAIHSFARCQDPLWPVVNANKGANAMKFSIKRQRRQTAFVVLLLIAAAGTAFAQYDTGGINGTVRDTSGAVIPGATVTCVNLGTQRTDTTQTSSEGEYVFSPLPVGSYRITAAKSGFETGIVQGIPVNISITSRADLTLKVGSTNQTVTVSASQVAVNTANADVGMTIPGSEITELPSNGREWETSLAVVPGNGTNEFEAGVGVLIDGADSNPSLNQGMGLAADRSDSVLTRESEDAIAEVQVMQGNYSAEYGRSMGDVINIRTKGGTNAFHGTVLEFYQNEALDARNWFATPGVSTPMTWNQFGGNLGGPILRNKLFFFSDYEGIRQTYTSSGQFHVLNAADRALAVPAIQPVLAAIPLGNGGPDPADPKDFDLYNANEVNTHSEDTGSFRLDWNPTVKDAFTARYNNNNSNTNLWYGIAAGQTTQTPQNIQFIKLSETHTFSPTAINEIGVASQQYYDYAYGGGGNFPVTSFSCFFCDMGATPGPALFQIYTRDATYEYLDTFTKTLGRHLLKAGVDIRHNLQNQRTDLQDSLSFFSISDFLQNSPWEMGSLYTPLRHYRNTNEAYFFNDDFRVLHNLTLNLGVRYEYNTILHEKNNQVANFDIATQTLLPPSQHIYDPDYTEVQPRFGFAWDPWSAGKTVLHGGFGLFYEPTSGGFISSEVNNTVHDLSWNVFEAPINCTPALVLAYPLPDPLPTCTPVPAFAVTEIDPKTRNMYEEHWSLGIQQQLVKNVTLDTSYVASHTVHLGMDLTNGPNFNSQNPYTGVYALTTAYTSETLNGSYYGANFNSLAIKLNGSLRTVSFNFAGTWQHIMDDMTGFFGSYQDPYDPAADWAGDGRGVQLNGDVIYHAPALPKVPRLIGGGWELSALEQHSPGSPFSIMTGNSTIYDTGQRPDRVAGVSMYPANKKLPFNQLNKAAFADPPVTGELGTMSRNAAIGPATQWLDMSAMKNISIGERWRTEFRIDAFNVLNHPTFGSPDGTMTDATFGETTSTSGASRVLQLSAKFMF